MTLKIFRLLVLGLVVGMALSLPATAQDATRYVSVIDDLPLMSGLNEIGEGVEFTTPQGRLAETTASGALSRQAVLDFYAQTLPQLGWVATAEGRFVREGETLDLLMGSDGGVLSVRFSLAPSKN